MDAVTANFAGQSLSTVRRARWFLFGMHIALLAVAPVFTITGFEGGSGSPAIAVLAALAIGALQLRHSFAAARGEQPRGWPWTLLALAVLVYLPMVWFGMGWAPMQYFVIASAVMLLRGWPAGIAAATPLLATAAEVVGKGPVNGESAAQEALAVLYWTVGLLTAAGISTRLEAPRGELSDTVDDDARAALRTAVASLLRDDAARRCSIVVTRQDGRVRLELRGGGTGPATARVVAWTR